MLLPPCPPDDATLGELTRAPDRFAGAAEHIFQRHGCSAPAQRFTSGSMPVLTAESLVVKFFPRFDDVNARVEQACLEAVSGLPAPRVLDVGELEGWRFLLMTRVPGVPMERVLPTLPAEAQLALLRDLARVTRGIHAAKVDAVAALRPSWNSVMREQLSACVARQRAKGLAPSWLVQVEEKLPSLVAPVSTHGAPHLLHTELGPGHVLVDDVRGAWRVTGVIDFADALAGPPELDFVAVGLFICRGDMSLLRAFLLEYGVDDVKLDASMRRRLMGLMFLHRYSNLCWYLREVPTTPGTSTLAELEEQWWGVDRQVAGTD